MARTRSKRSKRRNRLLTSLLALLLGLIVYFRGTPGGPEDHRPAKQPDQSSSPSSSPAPSPSPSPSPAPSQEPATASFTEQHPKDFDAAKRILRGLLPHGEEFYCACSYDFETKQVLDPKACGFKAHSARGRRIEWEHVVPASAFGRHFAAWSAGDPTCFRNGQMKRGRNCAREVSEVFRKMEADLYNLLPAVGELNRARANFVFGEVEGEPRKFGACDFEVHREVVEPRPSIRGDIARIYFYMDGRYPEFGILSPNQVALFEEWNKSDPIDASERARLQAIEKVQGNSFFIGRLAEKKRLGGAAARH